MRTGIFTIITSTFISWFNGLDNEILQKIVSLLTILVILIGVIDWLLKKRRKQKKRKRQKMLQGLINTQKPFKVVNMLENPTNSGEKICGIIDDISRKTKGIDMKKFFKWVWYNKEQLLSIFFNALLLGFMQYVIWTDKILKAIPDLCGTPLLLINLGTAILVTLGVALTVRDVIVKYGLSSLNTINDILKDRAEQKAKELTPEQRKTYKNYISTLKEELFKEETSLKETVSKFEELTALHSADSSLVADYEAKKVEFARVKTQKDTLIKNIKTKIDEYSKLLEN